MTKDENMPAPLVSSDVDLRDFPFMPLDVVRLRDSDLAATPDGEVFRAAVLSWCASWHQIPAASMPDDDAVLARLLGYGRDVRTWQKLREAGALRGWVKCADGRLYHPVVAEKANDAWQAKIAQRNRTEAARQARLLRGQQQKPSQEVRQGSLHTLSQESDEAVTEVVTASKGQGQGQGQGEKKETPSNSATPSVREAFVQACAALNLEISPNNAVGLQRQYAALTKDFTHAEIVAAAKAAAAKGAVASSLNYLRPFLAEARTAATPQPVKLDVNVARHQWDSRCRVFFAGAEPDDEVPGFPPGRWNVTWGPKPGEDGCHCPIEIVAKWRAKAAESELERA